MQKQEFQMKMHDMISKTYKITRRKDNKYVNMYNETLQRQMLQKHMRDTRNQFMGLTQMSADTS